MNKSQEILSQITIFQKYAKFIPELNRRENWEEIVQRNIAMHVKKYPNLKSEIQEVYKKFVMPKKVLASMRSFQFAGSPIELANNRMFNCSYMTMDDPHAFSESMFLLLGGSGVGFSVQKRHTEKLPIVQCPKNSRRRFLVGDSIEGWADAVKVLMESYFYGKADPDFDYRDIRPKGSRLITSGGKAPGPDPLRICIDKIRSVLNNACTRRLEPLEVHDIMCHIADAVLSGGIRRAAMISLFDKDDMDMLTCKSGAWWELNPQRGRANNSVSLDRNTTTKEEFNSIWERVMLSGAGEPGVYWTSNLDWGTNPCVEIGLKPNQFCNLTEVNVSDVTTQEELNARVQAAAFIGTLQAGYTDFHYLREVWKKTTEEESLLGVSMTGIGSGTILDLDLKQASALAIDTNREIAQKIGINPAARVTAVKPAGTTSLVVGSSSGIHAWHNDYYIRRMRVGKNEPLYRYMKEHLPRLVEDCKFKPHIEAVMSFPQSAPDTAILRTEKYKHLLKRVKKFNEEWVSQGHISGDNKHNVSCTISLKNGEWINCGDWMWNNRDSYSGISVLPYDGGTYVQAPFEDCTKEEYDELYTLLESINLDDVSENEDNTSLTEQAACSGGACEVGV